MVLGGDFVVARKELSQSDGETLLQIRKQIDENYAEPLTIAELSKKYFMSESKLQAIFRQQYGITIYQYVLNRRLECAQKLLAALEAQVKDVAALVRYSNISHFSEAFRRKFGCTPSEYKKTLSFQI